MTRVTKRVRAALENMRLPDLQQRFAQVTGESTRSPNKAFLVRRIVEAMESAPEETGEQGECESAHEPDQRVADGPVAGDVESAAIEPGDGSSEVDAADEVGATAIHEIGTAVIVEPEGQMAQEPLDGAEVPYETRSAVVRSPWTEDQFPATLASNLSSSEDRDPELPEVADTPAQGGDMSDVASAESPRRPARGELTGLTIEELQAKYLAVVGRPTGSSDKAYLVWKIREAMKGKVPTGPRTSGRRSSQGDDVMVLPLRLPATTVDAMDHAWRSCGIRTRMDFLRDAIRLHLERLGAHEAAALMQQPSAELAQEAP
jgi:hypothetical protein